MRIWPILKRTLAAIVIVIATIAFLANAAGLVGIWLVRQPARNTVTTLSSFVNTNLGKAGDALARVSARVDESRQALAGVNDSANNLSDRLEQNAPLLTVLANTVRDNVAPKIAEARPQAVALRDAVLSVNAALETLNSLGFTTVPTFTDELSAVSDRLDSVRDDVQELRATIDEARAGTLQNLVAATTTRIGKIDNGLVQIKSSATKYQGVVSQKQQQVSDRSRTLLRVINLLALSLTVVFLVVAAGQLLLIYVCWQIATNQR